VKNFLFFLFLLSGSHCWANYEVALKSPDLERNIGGLLEKTAFTTDGDQPYFFKKGNLAQGFLLVPIYAHCKSVCPLTVSYLKKIEPGMPVVLFSFNPKESSQDLRDFRKALEIPPQWVLLNVTPTQISPLLEGLGFQTMTAGEDFAHPSGVFLISSDLAKAKFFGGNSFTRKDLVFAKEPTHLKIDVAAFIFLCFLLILIWNVKDFDKGIQSKVYDLFVDHESGP
jgi:cytochrome oxidase Cu insertion factor (SCO1/SenC/PrrC family)